MYKMLSVSVYYDVYSSDFMIVDDASWPLFSCLHGQDTLCLPLASQRMETVCFYFTFSPHIDHNATSTEKATLKKILF